MTQAEVELLPVVCSTLCNQTFTGKTSLMTWQKASTMKLLLRYKIKTAWCINYVATNALMELQHICRE